MHDITVIISTYNRPGTLLSALESVRWQTLQPEKVLVIGDCCSPDTGEALKKVHGLPLHYINLRTRFGEQAGPNSIGIALARTRYIAFLNHDDLWLPDHLARTLETLQRKRADFVTARAAFGYSVRERADRVMFVEASPLRRRLSQVFAGPSFLFEPASSWLITAAAARRMKGWRAAATLYRTPVSDWILRAWRAGLRHANLETITVLKHNVRDHEARDRGQPLYQTDVSALDAWRSQIATVGVDGFRQQIAADLTAAASEGRGRDFSIFHGPAPLQKEAARVLTPLTAAIFRLTGRDALDDACARVGLERAWQLRRLLKRRTGEALPPPPDFDAECAWAAAELARIEAP